MNHIGPVDTPQKFNLALKKLPSQKENTLSTIIFQGLVPIFGGVIFLQSSWYSKYPIEHFVIFLFNWFLLAGSFVEKD